MLADDEALPKSSSLEAVAAEKELSTVAVTLVRAPLPAS
jgi:hypothetical protein